MKTLSRLFYVLFLLSALVGCDKHDNLPVAPPPPPSPPVDSIGNATITTNSVSDIAEDSADISVTISLHHDPDSIIAMGVCYDTTASPDVSKQKAIKSGTGTFTCTAVGLGSGQTYYVRAFIWKKNIGAITYGNQLSFRSAHYPAAVGGAFNPAGSFNGSILSLSADGAGNVYAGGGFWFSTSNDGGSYVAKWNGQNWQQMSGLRSSAPIQATCTNASGGLFAGVKGSPGLDFDVMGYYGNGWNMVGTYNPFGWFISGVCADNSGNVYAIGSYKNTGGKYYVAKWGPGGYQELGSFDALLLTICTDAAGNLYAAGLNNHGYGNGEGNFYIAKWNGSSWSELGTFNNGITSMCFDRNGNLIVAGAFNLDANGNILSGGPTTNAGAKYYVAKWNGSAWSALGDFGIYQNYGNYITRICTDPSGNVYAIGGFQDANGRYYVAKWDGSSWTELASFHGAVNAICSDSHGNIYAGGNFTDRQGNWYVAKCN